jgi:hypothetical protein
VPEPVLPRPFRLRMLLYGFAMAAHDEAVKLAGAKAAARA